jgi:hypothetical protein
MLTTVPGMLVCGVCVIFGPRNQDDKLLILLIAALVTAVAYVQIGATK